ncbi:aminotransferase class I/II-fold pyridoxal phosphate-dependent enzyme, partial [Rhodomicrobium udaipurense]
MLRPYEDALARLEERGRLRQLTLPSGYDFTSNDYLGLAESHELREAVLAALERGIAIGAGGSRLLRGNYSEHESLEADAAKFFGAESALFFSNGFQANYAIFAALPKRG